MTLGVFGGTFNPVHFAHLRVAEEVREALGLARILWVPAADPPHKRGDTAPVRHRLEMVRIATATNPCFEVLDLELRRRGPSYTVDTLRELLERYPGAHLWFVIGTDAIEEIESWSRPDEVFEIASMAVVSRPGRPRVPLETLLPRRLAAPFRVGPNGLEHQSGHELRLVPVSSLEISASDVRRRVERGASIRYLIPEPVIEYIDKHQLYRERA
ncbi:MAG: nicotinate-nucleotide adenylyltransferase [Myxococcota bacterium]